MIASLAIALSVTTCAPSACEGSVAARAADAEIIAALKSLSLELKTIVR
jgi:hypothetical protein